MPRLSRIDAPGALHHIIARGTERKEIFRDHIDKNKFLARLGSLLLETNTTCFAWALIPNHFHLLLRTGSTPISTVMRRLLTGHAVDFNRRHKRHGHLFQNRYKSILCQEENYLLELVRYIHLNPLRARLVSDQHKLRFYPYCGHSAIMGKKDREWQNTHYILRLFHNELSVARRRYNRFVSDGITQGKREDLIGGGLIRSQGGWSAVIESRKEGTFQKGDERILGSTDFVEEVLQNAEEQMKSRTKLQMQGFDFDQVVTRVAQLLDITTDQVLAKDKKSQSVAARSILCFWMSQELGESQAWLARKLGVSQPTVCAAVARGKNIVAENSYLLIGN